MSNQFFLIKLYDDPSDYTEVQWNALLEHIREHDGKDVFWIVHKGRLPSTSDSLASIPPLAPVMSCSSFKSELTLGEARKRIVER